LVILLFISRFKGWQRLKGSSCARCCPQRIGHLHARARQDVPPILIIYFNYFHVFYEPPSQCDWTWLAPHVFKQGSCTSSHHGDVTRCVNLVKSQHTEPWADAPPCARLFADCYEACIEGHLKSSTTFVEALHRLPGEKTRAQDENRGLSIHSCRNCQRERALFTGTQFQINHSSNLDTAVYSKLAAHSSASLCHWHTQHSCESAPVVGPGPQMSLDMSGPAEGAGCRCSPLTCRQTCLQLSRFVMSQRGSPSDFNTDQGTGSEDNAFDLTHRLRRGLVAHPDSGARKAGLTTQAQGGVPWPLVSVNPTPCTKYWYK
jgi:hypothetical protein